MPKEAVLESAVMEVLWSSSEPLTTRQVRDRLDRNVAYTTVMTVLARLWNKGLLDRRTVGRAFAYRPKRSREHHIAVRMEEILDATGDRHAALSRFVQTLSESERRQLRDLLGES